MALTITGARPGLWAALSDDVQEEYVEILDKSGVTAECENAEFPLVFSVQSASASGTVNMYVDGGDSFDPACLFHLILGDGSPELVHVPLPSDQETLVDASGCYFGERRDVPAVVTYLQAVLNDATVWSVFEVGATQVPRLADPYAGLDNDGIDF